MNTKIFLFSLIFFTVFVACKEKKSSIECYNPTVHCSHRFGCAAFYICTDRSVNNMMWYEDTYDCVSDEALARGCAALGFPCENRQCAPPAVPCANDEDCPTLGVCDVEKGKCVEYCVCVNIDFVSTPFVECNWGTGCESDAYCGKWLYCDTEQKKCMVEYCLNNGQCSSGNYCRTDPPVEHFCTWFTDRPAGTCAPSTRCERNEDCTDPSLPKCDARNTCVPHYKK